MAPWALTAPCSDRKRPAGQRKQAPVSADMLHAEAAILPARQVEHDLQVSKEVLPTAKENLPASQSMQALAPAGVAANLPALQSKHATLPPAAANLPAGHVGHTVDASLSWS